MDDDLRSVLIVEDDGPMRAHLAGAIEAHPQLSLQAACETTGEALAQVERSAPEVLVADLELPDGSGLDVIRALRARAPESVAMVVTVLGDERSVVSAIQSGASGYLLKDESVDQIGASILQLLEGGSPISPPIARFLLRRMQSDAEPAKTDTEAPTLSGRELEVLELVAKGFRFPEIAKFLDISTHTVTTYVRRIYAKLEVGSKGEAVYEAVHLGLLKLDE